MGRRGHSVMASNEEGCAYPTPVWAQPTGLCQPHHVDREVGLFAGYFVSAANYSAGVSRTTARQSRGGVNVAKWFALALLCLTAISVRETTLISRTAVPFRSTDIAARERRSGSLAAQMNATVSRMSRMRQRPSMNVSTSSFVIGFHQSRSRTVTLPFSVPNFGFSESAVVVRTISTTGVPCRQIVTRSPSSTALIN